MGHGGESTRQKLEVSEVCKAEVNKVKKNLKEDRGFDKETGLCN